MLNLKLNETNLLQPTQDQQKALEMIQKLSGVWKGIPLVAILAGQAGTGKSSCISMANKLVGGLIVICPTGKAALRIREISNIEAMTIHRWIFKAYEDPKTGEIFYKLKPVEEIQRPSSGIVVIDEASMVGQELWENIHNICEQIQVNIVCVGDPFQLPPVSKGLDYFSLLAPNFKYNYRIDLNQILRQALDSPIIRASAAIKANSWMNDSVLHLPRVEAKDLIREGTKVIDQGGVIIVHKNATRHVLNKKIREGKGYPNDGQSIWPNEPLLVLKNQYELDKMNGEICTFQGWDYLSGDNYSIYDPYNKTRAESKFGRASVDKQEVSLAIKEIYGEMPDIGMTSIERMARRVIAGKVPFLHTNFGYTLSAHKSQGSQWPIVLVVVESSMNIKELEGRRHFYTSITRAEKEVKICWDYRETT